MNSIYAIREFFRYLVLLVVVAAGLLVARSHYWGEGKAYPLDMVLSNKEGRKVELTVMGRNNTTVDVKRIGSHNLVAYPIQELTLMSKLRLWVYPTGYYSNHMADQKADLGQIHRNEVMKRIDQLSTEFQSLGYKINAAETEVEKNTYGREQEDVLRRLQKLRLELDNRGG
ncbi:MAG: hypothetical protein HRT56_03355 [Coraliomargarita sp.]|nr:hypothetical protein [Coraliomargarita sp.]